MVNNKILVCIAFHNNIDRIQYIKKVIENYNNYQLDVDIIVDTNETLELNVKTVVHKLEHPYHLTYMHRKHFIDNIDVYDYFMYVEDDMLVPYDSFNEYINNFGTLWNMGCVPSFIRIESYNDRQFVTDIINKQNIEPIIVNNKMFTTLSEPYHAFWIMPQKQLKESINYNFTDLNTSREDAASYPMWTLNKRPLIRIENNKISELCYSYHLANNYASNPDTRFGKIEVKDIFKINNMIDNTQDKLIIEQENSIVKRYDLVNYIINKYEFKDYLEIGVAFGHCIRKIEALNKDGVDPVVEENVTCPEINYKMDSNEFFALPEIANKKYDVIFIDGLHHSEQVDIDIKNALEHLNDGGFIFLHDCNPCSYDSQLVPRQAVAWNGDVWKSIVKLRHLDINLDISVVNTDYGVGVISKGKNTPIDRFTLEESLNWNTFASDRKYFLNLLEIDEFFDKYSY